MSPRGSPRRTSPPRPWTHSFGIFWKTYLITDTPALRPNPSRPDVDGPNDLLWEALPELTLSAAQTAALCGISVRQLGYWTRQGYLAAQGQGTRRTYGLGAVRRVLALRKAMDGGASLRQALRLIPHDSEGGTALVPPRQDAPEDADAEDADVEDVARGLRGFFGFNPHARDHAGGLAVKLGRAEPDVRRAAERLCRDGFLQQYVCQEMTIFRQADSRAPASEASPHA